MSDFEGGVAIGATGARARLPEPTDDFTTAEWIAAFNTELVEAEVPEITRVFALESAIHFYFQRSGVVLAKKADA